MPHLGETLRQRQFQQPHWSPGAHRRPPLIVYHLARNRGLCTQIQFHFMRRTEELRSNITSDHPDGSASVGEEAEETGNSDLVSRVLSAAKIVGLTIPTDIPSPAEGV